jgi:hypothetical protein
MVSGCPYRVEELAHLELEAVAVAHASAMTLRRHVVLRLHYQFGPEGHRIQFETRNRVFFGERSRFLLPEFEESIKFTVRPAA